MSINTYIVTTRCRGCGEVKKPERQHVNSHRLARALLTEILIHNCSDKVVGIVDIISVEKKEDKKKDADTQKPG